MIFTFFFTVLALFLAAPQTVRAADPSLFMVEGIKVDVTADDAVSAQEQAFEQAQQQAFDVLAERMVSEKDVSEMARPEAGMIASMIKDYEVSNEQVSAVRYVGEYTFHFDPKAVGNYFSITGVQYTDTKSKPLLILPVFQKDGRTILWGEENIWLESWNTVQFRAALVPVEVPIGDLDDVADINDDNALRFERKSLDRMLLRYNAREAAIMIAVPDQTLAALSSEQQASGSVRVSIYRTDRGAAEYVSDFLLSPQGGQTVAQLYEQAVSDGFRALQKNWKKRTAASASQSEMFYVRMPVNGLEELTEAKAVLRTLPGMGNITVVSLTPSEVRLLLDFRGNEIRLREALRSGSAYLLSQPYNKDPQAVMSSLTQEAGVQIMYDLYHREKVAAKKRTEAPSRPASEAPAAALLQPTEEVEENPDLHTF